jgi:pimeloyl-ACP methyl ester carboxylesterase
MLNRPTAVAATILLILCSACTRPGAHAKSSPTPSPEQGAIAWTDCGGGFQCGSLSVPLDYSNPTADTIKIALVKKPATDSASRIGSLLTNPGGPGASGIDFVRSELKLFTNLNTRFDLIGFDPRGVGQSAPVRCLNGNARANYDALDSVLDDLAEKAAALQAAKAYAAACATNSGKVLPFVDTVSAAKDMDLIRIALGDAKLSYYGVSYGTFLGDTYAHLFPTHVRGMVLDGVVDPKLSAIDLMLQQNAALQRSLDATLSACAASSTCQLRQLGDPATQLRALMQQIDSRPLTVGSRQLTRALAVTAVAIALYEPSTWSEVDQGLTAAVHGDGSILLALSDLLTGRQPDGSYTNETDANFAVNCLDRPVPKDITAFDNLGHAFAQSSWLFGSWDQYAMTQCLYWPAKATGRVGPITADGAPPLLLVSATDDPITPYAWGQSVAQQIPSAVLLTRRGNGHWSYDKSTCAQQAEDDYLINLTTPAPGTVCS